MAGVAPLRGRVYAATLDDRVGEKIYLVVSNNQRNRQLGDVLGVRVTTSPKPDLDTIVECKDEDPIVGLILCDHIVHIYRDEIARDLGAVTRATMRRVDDGLRAALSLR
jgi:mRNA interferase MazF